MTSNACLRKNWICGFWDEFEWNLKHEIGLDWSRVFTKWNDVVMLVLLWL